MASSPRVRVIGGGRAGSAFASALGAARWNVVEVLGRGASLDAAGRDVDLVLIATPDGVVAGVAQAIDPSEAVVAHVAGSLALDVLDPHRDCASVHPLVALPAGPTGAARLGAGGWFAVAGSTERGVAMARSVVTALHGRLVEVADAQRIGYHAAACIASNHLVALLGQVDRIAAAAGVPLDAYLDLVRATVDNVADLGPVAALTGPVARGDWATVARHVAALAEPERQAYLAMAVQARRLVDAEFEQPGLEQLLAQARVEGEAE